MNINEKKRRAMKRSTSNGDQQGLRTPLLRWASYTFESVHEGNHKGVVRIIIGLSCKPWGCLFNVTLSRQLHYITWNNFSPTRSARKGRIWQAITESFFM